MTPPSLRISDERHTEGGDLVRVWDLRVAQPNVSHLAMPVVHSIEHFLGSRLRAASPAVVAFAPMGCQTGFYIVTIGPVEAGELMELLARELAAIAGATEVPLASNRQCGWATNHSLTGAQDVAAWLLRHRDSWHQAGPED